MAKRSELCADMYRTAERASSPPEPSTANSADGNAPDTQPAIAGLAKGIDAQSSTQNQPSQDEASNAAEPKKEKSAKERMSDHDGFTSLSDICIIRYSGKRAEKGKEDGEVCREKDEQRHSSQCQCAFKEQGEKGEAGADQDGAYSGVP